MMPFTSCSGIFCEGTSFFIISILDALRLGDGLGCPSVPALPLYLPRRHEREPKVRRLCELCCSREGCWPLEGAAQKGHIVVKIVGFSLWRKIVFSAVALHTAVPYSQCRFCCFRFGWIRSTDTPSMPRTLPCGPGRSDPPRAINYEPCFFFPSKFPDSCC